MSINSVNFKINNTAYTIQADVDEQVLQIAVNDLNERIEQYKNKTHRDEIRATVLAALSIAMERNEMSQVDTTVIKESTLALKEMIQKIDTVLDS